MFWGTVVQAHVGLPPPTASTLPVRTPLFLGSREELAIASLVAQRPLDLMPGKAWEEDNAARLVALHWGNSTHVVPELWVMPTAA